MFTSIGSLLLLLGGIAHADLDVAFVLDTTGSMSGEINEARSRVRELAEALRAARPNERVRLGVVAYRDQGDAYLTRVSQLTDQVALTSRFLDGLQADGGGDAPEDVIEALRVALDELDWDPGAERQLFLIADAKAHTDYEDHQSLSWWAERARQRHVIINAIGCRSLSPEGIAQFRTLAYATEGQYHHIGRVEADAGGVADAMLQTLAPAPAEDGPLRPLSVFESGAPRAAFVAGVQEPVTGIVVRLGTWLSPLEHQAEQPGSACSLTVLLPEGIDLAGPPQLALGSRRLHATLALAPVSASAPATGSGGRSVWELERCLPIATPIETDLR